ncbi:hypothetical protein EIP91_005710 [Steccherinum ochraceum]|uniref:C3H1-type domain-containing protein n=1 Tax=Steccherinum ochraceum TaxID=92696 RepID=A0A4R0RHS5_9APHY|nr:hypothetical protein EIP91_005710 [Steccherinum ochraceum]
MAQFYDDEGRPREMKNGTRGCERGERCTFSHPSDPEWETAQKVPPPYKIKTAKYESPSYAQQSAPHRSSPPRTRGMSPAPSSSSSRGRGRTPPPPPTKPPPPPPARQHTPLAPASDVARDPRGRVPSGPGSTAATTSSKAAMPPPPPPPSASKAPPTSRTPSISSARPSPAPREASRNERIQLWVERIKTLGEAVTKRVEYVQLEKEIESFRRLAQNSWRFQETDEEDKARFNSQLASMETQFETIRSQLNSLVSDKLVDLDFWPTNSESIAGGLRNMVEDLSGQVKGIVEDVRKMGELRLSSSSHSHSPTPTKDEPPKDDAPRPAKRRRVEDGDVVMADPVTQAPVVPLGPDFEDFKERVLKLEESVAEMNNELVQYDNHLLTELQDQMESRFEEYGLVPKSADRSPATGTAVPSTSRQPSTTPGSVPPAEAVPLAAPSVAAPAVPGAAQDTDRIAQLEMGYSSVDRDIRSMALFAADLKQRVETRNEEIVLLHRQNELLQAEVITLKTQNEATMKEMSAQREELQALKAAVTVYVSQARPQQPEPRAMPTVAEIVDTCTPDLLHAMRLGIQPLLEDMKAAVESMLENKSLELCNVVLAKLASTLQMVQKVASFVDKQNGLPTTPILNGTAHNNLEIHAQQPPAG